MILGRQELSLLRRGRRWFTVSSHPGWKEGDVVRLRNSARDEPFVITVSRIQEDAGRFRVEFLPGDLRADDVFIAAGWPDYTNDPFRAMPGEPPPMPETRDERKSRTAWLALALRHTGEPPRRRIVAPRVVSATRRERVVFEAGSDEAVRVVRLWAR